MQALRPTLVVSAELRFARNPRLSLFIDFLPACVLDTMRHNLGP